MIEGFANITILLSGKCWINKAGSLIVIIFLQSKRQTGVLFTEHIELQQEINLLILGCATYKSKSQQSFLIFFIAGSSIFLHQNPYDKYSLSKISSYYEILPDICSHDSEMEREADKAEREVLDLKMAEYMQREYEMDSGKIYEGKIIDMTPYDTKIKLKNNIIGHVTPQDVAHAKAVGHNQKLKLGEKVYVLIKEVSIPHRIIYFNLNYKELSKPKQKVLR